MSLIDIISFLSGCLSIVTPFILLAWFYYSQKRALAKIYFDSVPGIYAGWVDGLESKTHAGIIMNIREIDGNGWFKGELEFKEKKTPVDKDFIRWSNKMFLGKLNFEIKKDKDRHPFKPKENRVYKGMFYFVSRFDFLFDQYTIETYLEEEFEIVHYREMDVIEFTRFKTVKESALMIPERFTLQRKGGYNFEPYSTVKQIMFPDTDFQ